MVTQLAEALVNDAIDNMGNNQLTSLNVLNGTCAYALLMRADLSISEGVHAPYCPCNCMLLQICAEMKVLAALEKDILSHRAGFHGGQQQCLGKGGHIKSSGRGVAINHITTTYVFNLKVVSLPVQDASAGHVCAAQLFVEPHHSSAGRFPRSCRKVIIAVSRYLVFYVEATTLNKLSA